MKIDFLILYPSFLFHSKCSKFIKCACFHYFSSCQLSEKFTNLPLFCLKWREENYPEEELKSKLGHMMGLLFLILDSVLLAAAAAKSLVVSDSVRPHRRQPTRLPRPWDSPGKNTGVGCHFLPVNKQISLLEKSMLTLANSMHFSRLGRSLQMHRNTFCGQIWCLAL